MQTDVARELGIMPTMLRRLQRALETKGTVPAAKPLSSSTASSADQASEIVRLRRELDRTRMALTSHLLDVGFDDRWCARHIGLHIDKALAYANATGLNYHSAVLQRLAPVLSPYNVWRNPDLDGSRPPIPKSLPDIPALLRGLLDHVRGVTGHPRPRRRQAHG